MRMLVLCSLPHQMQPYVMNRAPDKLHAMDLMVRTTDGTSRQGAEIRP